MLAVKRPVVCPEDEPEGGGMAPKAARRTLSQAQKRARTVPAKVGGREDRRRVVTEAAGKVKAKASIDFVRAVRSR